MADGMYRRKPVVVEAFRWSGWIEDDGIPNWFKEALGGTAKVVGNHAIVGIGSDAGWERVGPGYWIVRDGDGLKAYSAADFVAEYQRV